MDRSELERLAQAIPERSERVDISEVQLDMEAPAQQRAEEYLRQIRNPYHFRCGEIAVNLQFDPQGKSLVQAVQAYLAAKAGGG